MTLAQLQITDSLQGASDSFFAFLPKLVGFLVILLIGYVVARMAKGILTRVLQKVGLDRALHSGQAGQYVERVSPGASPARLIGSIAFWLLFLGALSIAVAATGVPALTAFLAGVFDYLPKIVAALIIFVVAGAVATAVGALVARTMGDTPTGKVVGTIVPVLVMAIAAFMILDQLKIAEDIVRITYMALMGGLPLALALAFGLGGREVAARMLEGAYQKGQEQREQVRQDMQKGKAQAREDVDRARGAAQERMGSGAPASGGSHAAS